METAVLSSKGQLVIPKGVRQRAKLAPGAVLAVSYVNGEVRLKLVSPLAATTLDEVAGCLADTARKRLTDAQAKTAISSRLKAKHAAR